MIELEELIAWLKENYHTVETPSTFYNFNGDYSDTVNMSICHVRKSENIKNEYHKRYSVSIEQLCKDIETHFKK